MKKNLTLLFFMLSFYCFGAGMIDSFAIYPSWLLVGEEEFVAVHQAGGQRIVLFLVLPILALTIIIIIMFWHRPVAIPKRLLWIAFVCQMISWLSSAFIQIPIQIQLDQGKDEALEQTDYYRLDKNYCLDDLHSGHYSNDFTHSIYLFKRKK